MSGNMSRSNVSRVASQPTMLDKFHTETKNTRYMLVKIGCVQFHVNYASGCAVGIIFMAYPLAKVIYAGVYAVPLFWDIFHLSPLDKNTLVTLYVLPRGFVK